MTNIDKNLIHRIVEIANNDGGKDSKTIDTQKGFNDLKSIFDTCKNLEEKNYVKSLMDTYKMNGYVSIMSIHDNNYNYGDKNTNIAGNQIINNYYGTTPTDKNSNNKKQDVIAKNKSNYRASYNKGKAVAKNLIGFTNKAEKRNIINNIMSLNPENVVGFMNGYNDNDTIFGIPYGKGGLIDQIDNEYGWEKSEKTACFKKIITTVLEFAKSLGFENDRNYRELEDMSKLVGTRDFDPELADKLVNELIARGQAENSIY